MSENQDIAASLDLQAILRLLPHRYPFLLVDRVVECVPNSHIKAYKNVTLNEPFFQGHFPNLPIMPGVLILEAMAQAAGILGLSTQTEMQNKLFLFRGVDGAKFRRQVIPGDRLDLVCNNFRLKMGVCKMSAKALVEGQVACEAELSAAIGVKS
ncbi:MAG: 3-hydroxyacyl-ACP dehydratase FabZ [Desulfovibrionaceae bacterium]|nr:3-hydroxyacyl-ACP dehydratase FabZ [Desulfovibrionaceae bacterium]